MLRKPKSLLLMLATILAAGCAHSDYGSSNRRNIRWANLDQPRNQEVQRAVEPKILPKTYFAAARLLEQEGDFGKAIVQYRKAIAVNHNFVAAYHRLGVLLSSMGRHDEAIQAFSRATLLAPQNVVLRNNYGYVFMVQARWEEAAHQFRRCTELRPQFTRAYINLGMTLTKLSRFDEAFQTFRVVLPEPDAHYNLGLMYRVQGRYDDAAGSFRQALEANPDFQAATTQLDQLADRITPDVTPSEKVVTAIPLGVHAEAKADHPNPAPPEPTAVPPERAQEVATAELPRLIAETTDDIDSQGDIRTMGPELPTSGPIEDESAHHTRTRDAMITLQPDRGFADRIVEPDTTPSTETTPEIETAGPMPPVVPTAEKRSEQRTAVAQINTRESTPTTETAVKNGKAKVANLDDISLSTFAKFDAPTVAVAKTVSPETIDATSETVVEVDHNPNGRDEEPYPVPNRDPAYVIIGPNEIDPALQKMRLAKKRKAEAREKTAPSIDKAAHVATAKEITADPAANTAAANRITEETVSVTASIEYSTPQEQVTEAPSYSPADEQVLSSLPEMDVELGYSPIMSVPESEDDRMIMAPTIEEPRPGRLDPTDSEAIIAAFEQHLRSFSDYDGCWDVIDWQVWEVIDQTSLVATTTEALETLAAVPATKKTKKIDETAPSAKQETEHRVPVLIHEVAMDTTRALSREEPAADPTIGSDSGDFIAYLDQDEPVRASIAPEPATPRPVGRRAIFHELRRQLKLFRDEISCWNEVLARDYRKPAQPGPELVSADIEVITPPARFRLQDIESEMMPVIPPLRSSYLDRLADRLPLVLDRSRIDPDVIVPSLLPPVAEVTAEGLFTPIQALSFRPTAVGLPILVREEWVQPCPPAGFEPSPLSDPFTPPAPEFDWQETFGFLDGVLSIVINESVCLDSLDVDPVMQTDAAPMRATDRKRSHRPTLASTIVEPTAQ